MVTKNMLCTYDGKNVFSKEEKIRFVTALDLIKYQTLLLTCATISELPSNISTLCPRSSQPFLKVNHFLDKQYYGQRQHKKIYCQIRVDNKNQFSRF